VASPTITVAGYTINRGQNAFVYTATQLTGADSDSNLDHFIATVLPTHGTLYKNGVAVVVSVTQFTVAEIAAGALTYKHDGTNNSDSVTFQAVDALGATSAATAGAITVTNNNGWLAIVFPNGHSPIVPMLYAKQSDADAYVALWATAHAGSTLVLMIPTTVTFTGLTRDAETYYNDGIGSPFGLRDAVISDEISNRLTIVLNESANSDLKTLVNTYGAAMDTNAVAMTDAQRGRWNTIRESLTLSNNRRRYVESSDFKAALAALKGTL
jgi:hypothetical protein